MKDMSEIIIPETTISDEQLDYNLRQLCAAIMYQATKDYCRTKSEKSKQAILKDLRSSRMDCITNGQSVIVAEQLELHPNEIKGRIIEEEN